jgi:hypothetical protein
LHPALAGGAAMISPPAISAAASPPAKYCFVALSFREVCGYGSICVGGVANIGAAGGWPGPIWAQEFCGMTPPSTVYVTQRCHVPSAWTGSSHFWASGWLGHPALTHPALAGGAAMISPPAINAAARPPAMYRFVVLSSHEMHC